ncbi:MAG: hypothetical protein HOW73_44425 [Polyangiaceae bacterium]|nr:hypothetical protein [Polyangiaceae bacterium]
MGAAYRGDLDAWPGADEGDSSDSSRAHERAPTTLLPRLSGPLNALVACGVARCPKAGPIELLFSEEECATGGMIAIAMPVTIRCPVCALDADDIACRRCRSKRTVVELFSAWLAVRPGTGDGTILTPSAILPDMLEPVSFRVRVGVRSRRQPS